MGKILLTLVSVLALTVLGSALAQGMTLGQAENAGFTCIDVGDGRGHCINARSGSAKGINVLVFESMDPSAKLVATEILLSPDVYNGQPCPTEGADEWLDIGFARACHHYVGP